MFVLYLVNKYLERLDDYKFEHVWETKITRHSKRLFTGLGIYYLVISMLLTTLLTLGETFFLLDLLVFIFVLFVYGYLLLTQLLKFIALNNQRYLEIKMNMKQDAFDKNNVVN
ncbi:MAG: hypothetical protein K9L74_00295 [Candidatus Izimaplasma sp.]|nr:hypothetical protein [Candidatus Izimaplasma bacterium]